MSTLISTSKLEKVWEDFKTLKIEPALLCLPPDIKTFRELPLKDRNSQISNLTGIPSQLVPKYIKPEQYSDPAFLSVLEIASEIAVQKPEYQKNFNKIISLTSLLNDPYQWLSLSPNFNLVEPYIDVCLGMVNGAKEKLDNQAEQVLLSGAQSRQLATLFRDCVDALINLNKLGESEFQERIIGLSFLNQVIGYLFAIRKAKLS